MQLIEYLFAPFVLKTQKSLTPPSNAVCILHVQVEPKRSPHKSKQLFSKPELELRSKLALVTLTISPQSHAGQNHSSSFHLRFQFSASPSRFLQFSSVSNLNFRSKQPPPCLLLFHLRRPRCLFSRAPCWLLYHASRSSFALSANGCYELHTYVYNLRVPSNISLRMPFVNPSPIFSPCL